MLPERSLPKSKKFAKKYLVLLLIVIPIIVILKSQLLLIRNVSCFINNNPCPDFLVKRFENLSLGKNLSNYSDNYCEQLIKNNFPEIKDFQVNKNYFLPSLQWDINLRTPIVIFKADQDYQIDEEGVVLAVGNLPGLPKLKVDIVIDHLEAGDRFSQDYIIKSLALIRDLRLNLFEPIEVSTISKFKTEIKLKTGEILIFSTQEGQDSKLGPLQLIFSRAKIEGRRISRIDLRFDKPVIVYE